MKKSVLITTYKDFELLEELEKCLTANMIDELYIIKENTAFKVEYNIHLNSVSNEHLIQNLKVFKKAIFLNSIVDFELKFDNNNDICYVNESYKEGFDKDSDDLIDAINLLEMANSILKNIDTTQQIELYKKEKIKGKYNYTNIVFGEILDVVIESLSNNN